MRIRKFNEDKDYYKELGYDQDMLGYMNSLYQLWSDAEGLPQLSADELIYEDLNDKQNEFVKKWLEMWYIIDDFETNYYKDDFVPNKIIKKFNL